MALERFQRALALTLAVRDAAIAGDGDRVSALLDERQGLMCADGIVSAEREQVRAILVEMQRLDLASIELLADGVQYLTIERTAFRRTARAAAAYVAEPLAAAFFRTG